MVVVPFSENARRKRVWLWAMMFCAAGCASQPDEVAPWVNNVTSSTTSTSTSTSTDTTTTDNEPTGTRCGVCNPSDVPVGGLFDLCAQSACVGSFYTITREDCEGIEYHVVHRYGGYDSWKTWYEPATGAGISRLRCTDIPEYCNGTSPCIWTGPVQPVCTVLSEVTCAEWQAACPMGTTAP